LDNERKAYQNKNDLSELEKIVSNVDVIAEEWNFSQKLAFNLNLVIEELVTNTISCGYGDQTNSKQEIEFHFSFDGETLTITLVSPLSTLQKELILSPFI